MRSPRDPMTSSARPKMRGEDEGSIRRTREMMSGVERWMRGRKIPSSSVGMRRFGWK